MGFCEEILDDGDYCLDPASERTGYRCDRCFTAVGPIPMPYSVEDIVRMGVRCWRVTMPGARDRVYIIPRDDGIVLFGLGPIDRFGAWTGHRPITPGSGIWEFIRH